MISLSIFGELPFRISNEICVQAVRHHSKASEAYLDVSFSLPSSSVKAVSVPVNYRRTGVDAQSIEDCVRILQAAYAAFLPEGVRKWTEEADEFWSDGGKVITKPFFDVMRRNLGSWVCQGCELPQNPNWARRTQDIKEMGYTFATNSKLRCANCNANKTHLMLLPIPRGGQSGYETWSPRLRSRIIKTLQSYDAYEASVRPSTSLLPDHKFPEIRWDGECRQENHDDMSAEKIREKFQLLSNQRNQQKREACRQCYQSGNRGTPFGISFFYAGDPNWPSDIPKVGRDAEGGCFGCGWYDLEQWRSKLNHAINRSASDPC